MDTQIIEHPAAIIKPGCLVFDIGANTGYMTALWKSAGAGTIVCVEACLENFVHLAQVPNLIPIHAAAWNTNTILPISFCPNGTGLSTCDPERWGALWPEAKYNPPQYVPTITLDELADKFGIPYFVKVDVEGAELPVISAMTFKPNYLIFEYHKNYLKEAIAVLVRLQELGFKWAAHADGELNIDLVPNVPIERFIEFWRRGSHGLGNITVC